MFDIIGFLNCLAEKNVERKEKRKKRRERKPSNLDSFSAGIYANEKTFNIFRYPDKK